MRKPADIRLERNIDSNEINNGPESTSLIYFKNG